MERNKNIFKVAATNKMMWVTLIISVIIIVGTTAGVFAISYFKNKTAQADVPVNIPEEEVIKQEELVDTSKMSEEELKKLNEEEQKKLEEKKKEEDKKNGTTTTKPVKNKYYIKVNYGAQTVTVYTYDKNGNYTIPVRAMVCSTGAATPTSGVYRLSWKATWGKLFGNVWGHYCCQVVGDILLHSVPYRQASNNTLIGKYYDKLGSKDSMGCIRLTTIDAQWIFYNCPSGTAVEFYYSSNPGPLGKPSATKVSHMPGDLKNWDPTDPDSRNPWIKYFADQKKNENNNQTNTNKPSTGNTEKPGNTTGGNTGNQGGSTGGNTGNQGGSTGGNTGDQGGSTGGNTGDQGGSTGGNTGDQGGSTGGNTGDQGGSTGGNTGDQGGSTGDNTGNQGGSTGDNTGNQGGTTGDNTGDQGGTTGDNTGDQGGTTGDETGSTNEGQN